ncbi:MAG: hypothetical protein HUK22_08830, partial [Thermoguttaceae bacterium]|nr:hypothetical protein [Thermoguttaceae bacterium]
IQDVFSGCADGETRWGGVLETKNPIFTWAQSGAVPEIQREFVANQFKLSFFDNATAVIETALEGEELESAREILAAFEAAASANIREETTDVAMALGAAPFVYSYGAKVDDAANFRRGIEALFAALRKANGSGTFEENAENVAGFSVSTIAVPFDDCEAVVSEVPYLAGKTFAARIGVAADAVLFVAGLDAVEVADEFARIAAASEKLTPVPGTRRFDLGALGGVAFKALRDVPKLEPGSVGALEVLAAADDAFIDASCVFDDSSVSIRGSVAPGVFRALGDVVRRQTIGGAGDPGEDLDDLFDDENVEETDGEVDFNF